MKKYIMLIVLTLFYSLFGLRNWESYTNTTHIFDAAKIDDTVYLATWGGLLAFDWQSQSFGSVLRKADGLVDTDIRSLFYDEESKIFYIGTKNGGISRIKQEDYLLPITTTVGLPSNHVKKIVKQGTKLFYATDRGLSVFIDDPAASLPILDVNISEENGLLNRNITALAISNTHVFCGSEDGLSYAPVDSVSYSQSWQSIHLSEYGDLGNKVNSLAINPSGEQLAIATTNGLLVLSIPDFSQISLFQTDELGGEASIYPVFWDADDTVWLSYGEWSEEALMIQNTGEKAVTKISNIGTIALEIEHVTFPEYGSQRVKTFQQLESGIAALTWGQGFYLQDESWQHYKSNCIVTNYVTDLKLDKVGALWIINGLHSFVTSNRAMKGVSCYKDDIWVNYTAEESPLGSNNILTIDIDEHNKKWFGTYENMPNTDWFRGVITFDDINDEWSTISAGGNNGLLNYLIPYIHHVSADEIWISSYDLGVQIFNSDREVQWEFTARYDDTNKIIRVLPFNDYCFIGTWYKGLEYWYGEGFPDSDLEDFWHQPLASDLTNGKIYDLTVRQTPFKTEFWVASAKGLFMFDEETWYRYGTTQKKQFLASFDNWQPKNITEAPYNTPEYWYVEGQERLYASVTTFPRVIYVDIYNRLWIGTQDNGFTIYSPEQDTYKTYNRDNSSLLSNAITSFEYNANNGIMYIGTENGLNSVEIGSPDENNTEKKLRDTIAYPNPFHPAKGFPLKIINEGANTMPMGDTRASIFDLHGQLIRTLKKDNFQEFTWDGTNQAGKKCSSGIYFYVVSTDDGQISRGKIILIR